MFFIRFITIGDSNLLRCVTFLLFVVAIRIFHENYFVVEHVLKKMPSFDFEILRHFFLYFNLQKSLNPTVELKWVIAVIYVLLL